MSTTAEAPAVAKLAASQLKRIRRIVDATVRLAEEGGFDGVRLRDVAEEADVALGTLYKYFRSKEDILLYALNEETQNLERVIAARPPAGGTPAERLTEWFARATRGLTRRPDFARAVIRAIASGNHATAVQVAGFHLRMSRMIVAALRDEPPALDLPLAEPVGSDREQAIARILNNFWFSTLIAWTGGLCHTRTITERMQETVSLLLEAPLET